MRGGVVIEACESKSRPRIMHVEVRDAESDTDIIRLWLKKDENSLLIQIGDLLEWRELKVALWTPKAAFKNGCKRPGKDFQIPIERIGFTGMEHPERLLMKQ